DLARGGQQVGYQRQNGGVVVLDGGNDRALLTASPMLAMQQGMHLDGGQQLTEVAPEADRVNTLDLVRQDRRERNEDLGNTERQPALIGLPSPKIGGLAGTVQAVNQRHLVRYLAGLVGAVVGFD